MLSTMALGPARPLDHPPGVLGPPRVPRLRPAPSTAATPALAASPVPTVPIPSDRDRAEPVRTHLVRLTPPPGDTPTAPAKLDAPPMLLICSALIPGRVICVPIGSESNRPAVCHASRRFVVIPLVQASFPSDIQELAGKGRLHTTDDDIFLLVRDPTPPPKTSDEPSSVGRAA